MNYIKTHSQLISNVFPLINLAALPADIENKFPKLKNSKKSLIKMPSLAHDPLQEYLMLMRLIYDLKAKKYKYSKAIKSSLATETPEFTHNCRPPIDLSHSTNFTQTRHFISIRTQCNAIYIPAERTVKKINNCLLFLSKLAA